MNQDMVALVVKSLFETLKEKEAAHPIIVNVLDSVETLAIKEIPDLYAYIQAKIGGG